MRKSKILIIISIIIILSILSGTLVYLYMATDVFKSDKELFAKYISQNEETLQKMADLKTIEVYQNLSNESIYESNTNVKMLHSEGGEVSDPLNNLSAKLDIQKNNEEQYMYADGQILFDGEEYLEAEIIKQQGIYGIRFSDVVKQFITIKEDENFENVAKNIGIDSKHLQDIIDVLNSTTEVSDAILPYENRESFREKYCMSIVNAVTQGRFSSLKNAMITYNNETIKTNAYSVELSSEQVEAVLLEILNNVKTENEILEKIKYFINKEDVIGEIDEIINKIAEENQVPNVKITVYVQKEQTIRTVIEMGMNKITLESLEDNGKPKVKIQSAILNEDEIIEHNIEITKTNSESQEIVSIIIEGKDLEENYTISLLNEMQLTNSDITLNSTISYKKDILTKEAIIENVVNVGDSFERKLVLDQSNNVVLNNLDEDRQNIIINSLKEKVPEKVEIRKNLIKDALENKVSNTENFEIEQEISQIDINKFNAKFEFYTGDAVSYENITTLLDIVKNNMKTYEFIPITNEGEEINEEEKKYTVKLYIEQNKQNEDGIKSVLEKINDKKKYKVSIAYKQSNGLIDYITINEVEN